MFGFIARRLGRGLAGVAAALALPGLACAGATGADAPQHLRIVGGLAGVNQYTRHEEPFWTRELPRLTEGRATAEIVPFDRAGIRVQEMLRLVQLGAVPFGTALLSTSAAQDAELAAPDLAGLNPDIASLRRTVAAFRPTLAALLRERYGAELLAVYVYPAQVSFCTQPLAGLADLAGRRVRVASNSQADWVSALGATPVQTGFAEIVDNVRAGNIDCAITGTMSGHTIGLDRVTNYLHGLPVTWGLAAFVANGAAWAALGPGLQAALRRQLPLLERAIWDESERETGLGIACSTGAADCGGMRKGRMTWVPASPADQRLRRDILLKSVLPAWIARCGPRCAELWRRTLAPASGIALP